MTVGILSGRTAGSKYPFRGISGFYSPGTKSSRAASSVPCGVGHVSALRRCPAAKIDSWPKSPDTTARVCSRAARSGVASLALHRDCNFLLSGVILPRLALPGRVVRAQVGAGDQLGHDAHSDLRHRLRADVVPQRGMHPGQRLGWGPFAMMSSKISRIFRLLPIIPTYPHAVRARWCSASSSWRCPRDRMTANVVGVRVGPGRAGSRRRPRRAGGGRSGTAPRWRSARGRRAPRRRTRPVMTAGRPPARRARRRSGGR